LNLKHLGWKHHKGSIELHVSNTRSFTTLLLLLKNANECP